MGRIPGPNRGEYVDPGTLWLGLSPPPAPLGLIMQSYIPSVGDLPSPPEPKQPQAPKPQEPPQPQQTLKEWVNERLKAGEFDIPMVADGKSAMFQGQKNSLDEITDFLFDMIHQVRPNTSRADVRSEVRQAYLAKEVEHAQQRWQFVIQMLYTPQYNLWTSPKQPADAQHGFQLSLGANYSAHRYGYSGWEHTLQVSGSFFNLGSDNNQKQEFFQNAMASYQMSYVAPIKPQFRFLGIPQLWSYLQLSVFAQLAAGVGTNREKGENKVYYGFLLQPSTGGQATLSIGSLQVIVQGSMVYSWLSPTTQSGSAPNASLGVQGGLGIGGSF